MASYYFYDHFVYIRLVEHYTQKDERMMVEMVDGTDDVGAVKNSHSIQGGLWNNRNQDDVEDYCIVVNYTKYSNRIMFDYSYQEMQGAVNNLDCSLEHSYTVQTHLAGLDSSFVHSY